MSVAQRFYTISQKEIDSIVNMAAGAGADAGIAAYKKAEQKARDNTISRNLNNTRKLLETYRTLKNDLIHSDYETDEAQKELRFKCVEDLMIPGGGNPGAWMIYFQRKPPGCRKTHGERGR